MSGIEERPAVDEGGKMTVRPISPQDFELELEFIDSLSPTAGYQRLFSPRKPSAEEIWRFTHIDAKTECAMVAVVAQDGEERMVGVGRWVMPRMTESVPDR